VSQNIPPNQPDRPHDAADQDAFHAEGANPYFASQHGAPPDLDANAPLLRSSDVQRLNRKALVFLAGIVCLLLLAVFWILNNAGSDDDTPTKPREEAVVIPALPNAQPDRTPSAEPVEVAPYQPADLPPLPVVDETSPDSLDYSRSRMQSLIERRMADGADSVGAPPQAPYAQGPIPGFPGAPDAGQALPAEVEKATSARFINKPDVLLVRGTYIRCVLETRIITDIPGFTSCIVTEPVYSINGRRLLLPKGSKVLGSYNYEPSGPRVAVVWDRITTPNGFDVSMSSPGVDNLGGAGHPGRYTAHWGSRIASALLISMISDAFKYAAAEEGPTTATIGAGGVVVQSPYESTTARTMERLANQALDTRRRPTVTINQGTVVNVYVSRDVDFSAVIANF
jgi:type IV secretion system protein VirB10